MSYRAKYDELPSRNQLLDDTRLTNEIQLYFFTSIFQIRVLFTLFYLQLLLFQISDSDLRLQFKFLICEFTTLLGVDIDGVWAAP